MGSKLRRQFIESTKNKQKTGRKSRGDANIQEIKILRKKGRKRRRMGGNFVVFSCIYRNTTPKEKISFAVLTNFVSKIQNSILNLK